MVSMTRGNPLERPASPRSFLARAGSYLYGFRLVFKYSPWGRRGPVILLAKPPRIFSMMISQFTAWFIALLTRTSLKGGWLTFISNMWTLVPMAVLTCTLGY